MILLNIFWRNLPGWKPQEFTQTQWWPSVLGYWKINLKALAWRFWLSNSSLFPDTKGMFNCAINVPGRQNACIWDAVKLHSCWNQRPLSDCLAYFRANILMISRLCLGTEGPGCRCIVLYTFYQTIPLHSHAQIFVCSWVLLALDDEWKHQRCWGNLHSLDASYLYDPFHSVQLVIK